MSVILYQNRRLPDFMRALDVIHQLDSRISKGSFNFNIQWVFNELYIKLFIVQHNHIVSGLMRKW